MRLFVGLPLASEVLHELSEAVARLRLPQDGLRWTTPESWHITLQFLGNTDQQHCDCVLTRLGEIEATQFRVRLGALGFFDRAGVFFTDVVPSADLVELAKWVTAATAKCGFVAEARPYHPHITLARAKGESKEKQLHALQERVRRDRDNAVPPLRNKAVKFHEMLYRSLSGHPLQFLGVHSTVHCSGPLSAEIDFSDQGIAEEDKDARIEALYLDSLSAQSLTYIPWKVVDVDISV